MSEHFAARGFKFYVKFEIQNMRRSRSLNNADTVCTASVARVGVRKGAGAPRNSERRPLTGHVWHTTST